MHSLLKQLRMDPALFPWPQANFSSKINQVAGRSQLPDSALRPLAEAHRRQLSISCCTLVRAAVRGSDCTTRVGMSPTTDHTTPRERSGAYRVRTY